MSFGVCYTHGVSVVDRIIQNAKERKARRDTAIAAFKALPAEDRHEVLAELIGLVEADAGDDPPDANEAQQPPQTPARASEGPETATFTDKGEAFVLQHPEGVTTRQVATAIGQKVESVDGTLRSVVKYRGTIERRDGKWWPKSPDGQKRVTHREITSQVLAAANRPMGAGDIIAAVQAIDPERKRESLEAELHRMREDGVIVQKGSNGRGSLYVLTNGGTSAS
jgi:hypothetical protein